VHGFGSPALTVAKDERLRVRISAPFVRIN
jgi:hypothetical protein